MVNPTKVRHKRPAFLRSSSASVPTRRHPAGNSDATLHVTVLDASGKAVSDTQVKVTLIMPAMPTMGMGEMRATTDLTWKGSDYVGTIKVPTAGSWNVEVNASRNGQLLGSYHARLNAQ
jgi:nitrogen fixation protein FixH